MLIYMYMYLIVAVGTHLSRLVGFWDEIVSAFFTLTLLYSKVLYLSF